jgi:hypothetical protein
MFWKSLVSAGLLCVLASPVLAVPQLDVSVPSGLAGLDANGNWVWNVVITPTAAGTPVAGELGFRETAAGGSVVTATRGASFDGANTANPGDKIFTWETQTELRPGFSRPEGLQIEPEELPNPPLDSNEVFAALGSEEQNPPGGPMNFVQIITAGPLDSRPTTSLQVLGAYPTAPGSGRIAEFTGGFDPEDAVNYSNFSGTATRTVVAGDANLSGNGTAGQAAVTVSDLSILATNLNKPGTFHWQHGDFNGTSTGNQVTVSDLSILATNLNKTALTGANTPLHVNGIADPPGAGAGLGGGSAVPEPATVALAALALLGSLGLIRRHR